MKTCLLAIFLLFLKTISFAQDFLTLSDSTSLHLVIFYDYGPKDSSSFSILFDKNGKREKAVITSYSATYDIGDFQAYGSAAYHITEKQLDKKGLPELIVYISYETIGIRGGGTTWKELHIWNLDTQEEMFFAMVDYSSQYGNPEWTAYPIDTSGGEEIRVERIAYNVCSWSYHAEIAEKQIIISEIQTENLVEVTDGQDTVIESGQDPNCAPDHQEGVYILKNGEFVRK